MILTLLMEDSHLIDGGLCAIGNSHADVGLTWSCLGNVKFISLQFSWNR